MPGKSKSKSKSESEFKSVRSKYHYGFYAAMKVFYDLAKAPVTYEQEKELGEEPIRLDFLIIKKNSDTVLDDPIGNFFRRVNICEYKSPDDSLSIDDFYKVQGYGLIYKSFDRKVNELPVQDMTITLVRHTYPRDMIKALRASGFVITQPHAGIYRFEGAVSIPTQLVVSSQLPAKEYEGLKLLAKGCTKSDVIKYSEEAISSRDANIMANSEAVINVCLAVNEYLSEELMEDFIMKNSEIVSWLFKTMKEAFDEEEKRRKDILDQEEKRRKEIFDKEEKRRKDILDQEEKRRKEIFDKEEKRHKEALAKIEAKKKQVINQGKNQEQKRVARDMLANNLPLPLIEKISKLSAETIRSIADSLGIAVIE